MSYTILTHESCRYGCEEKFLAPDWDSVLQVLHLSDEILQLKHLLEWLSSVHCNPLVCHWRSANFTFLCYQAPGREGGREASSHPNISVRVSIEIQ